MIVYVYISYAVCCLCAIVYVYISYALCVAFVQCAGRAPESNASIHNYFAVALLPRLLCAFWLRPLVLFDPCKSMLS